MKRIIFAMLIFALVFLCACTQKTSTYDVPKDGRVYTVNLDNRTITHGTFVYQFQISNNSAEITYPDNSTFFRSYNNNGYTGGWSEDYDETKYVSGDTLIDILEGGDLERSTQNGGIHPFFSIVLLIAGTLSLCFPKAVWYMNYGWRYKNAEPSDMALGMSSFGGGLAVFIAIITFFI